MGTSKLEGDVSVLGKELRYHLHSLKTIKIGLFVCSFLDLVDDKEILSNPCKGLSCLCCRLGSLL